MGLSRGSIVLAAAPGDYGRPRPAVVVQGAAFEAGEPPSVLVCPLTSEVRGHSFRVRVEPTPKNSLRKASEIMVDKLQALKRERLKQVVGAISSEELSAVDRALLIVLGLSAEP